MAKDNTTDLEEGLKFDDYKLRWDLLPMDAMAEVVYVYTAGAHKYNDRNWERGFRWGRSFAAVFRHAWAWWRGEEYDPDTGAHHLAQVVWNALTILHFALHKERYGKWDDRPKYRDIGNPEDRLSEYVKKLEEAWAERRGDKDEGNRT